MKIAFDKNTFIGLIERGDGTLSHLEFSFSFGSQCDEGDPLLEGHVYVVSVQMLTLERQS